MSEKSTLRLNVSNPRTYLPVIRDFFYQHLPPYLITEHVLLNTFVMLQGYFVLLQLFSYIALGIVPKFCFSC